MQIKGLRWAARVVLILSFVFAAYGYWVEKEDDLEDRRRIALFEQAFKQKTINISQPAPGARLKVEMPEYSKLPAEFRSSYEPDEWEKMRKQTSRFVAAVNQGLGDPFAYADSDDNRAIVIGVKEGSLRYHNAFATERPGAITTPINSSEIVGQRRIGWRVVTRGMNLFLRSGAPVRNITSGGRNVAEVGSEFLLASSTNRNATLRISLDGEGAFQTLRLAPDGVERKADIPRPEHGGYFVWDGRPFAVYRSNAPIGDATSSAVGDLVFTKEVNGRPFRMQVLGAPTANLIGSPVGGETRYIDGAFLHDKGKRLILTIDPEIQSAAYYLLADGLKPLDDTHPGKLRRRRMGSVTVLDAETGQILAQAGAPGYDPIWQGRRIVLANRSGITNNPANDIHMPGSSIKVMTAAMGYLLLGEGSGEMLPTSINQLAIRQAFRNVYGGALPPREIVDDTDKAKVTDFGRQYFDDHAGQPARPSVQFLHTLDSAFYVLDRIPDPQSYQSNEDSVRSRLFEHIVFGDLASYFDPLAKYDFFPVRSRFPVADIDRISSRDKAKRMDLFRMYALGGSEARFTTLRLATLLFTATSARLVNPFIVESIMDPRIAQNGGRVTHQKNEIFPELGIVLRDIEGAQNRNAQHMAEVMQRFLTEVCRRGPLHTGFYLNSEGKVVYMTENDPSIPGSKQAQFRQGDLGKTGTSDYGAFDEIFDDSIFVYRHGRYLIAIWMERADGQGTTHPANRVMNQIVNFIDELEPPSRGQ